MPITLRWSSTTIATSPRSKIGGTIYPDVEV
jgi:hypothetical protein